MHLNPFFWGVISSSKRAYVPALPFFSNCLPSSFIKLVVVLSHPSFVPRFNILLFIAVPIDVTAPKMPPPTFFNLSFALAAASLLALIWQTPKAPIPYELVAPAAARIPKSSAALLP